MTISQHRLGFIGLGAMGLPMVERLLEVGYQVQVWNRSPDKYANLNTFGANVLTSPRAVMDACDVACLCLTDGHAVDEIAFGSMGLLSGASSDRRRYIVDFSSVSPDESMSFAERARAYGVGWVDCPVSGGVPAARSGRLIMFAGGETNDVEAIREFVAPLFGRFTHMGASGLGQATKVVNQMIVACGLLTTAEAFAMARKLGVDVHRLPDALAGGFADSKPLQLFGPRMASHDYSPKLGAIKLMQKDVAIAYGLANKLEVRTPMLDVCRELYSHVTVGGVPDPEQDLGALVELFEKVESTAT